MNNNDLLASFIDDKLDFKQEKEFFLRAYKDSALRSSLKQCLKIEKTAGAHAIDSMPSAGSTANLFSSLGFEYPAAAGLAAASSSFFNKICVFIKTNSAAIISAGAASIVTASILLFTNIFSINDLAPAEDYPALENQDKIYYEEIERGASISDNNASNLPTQKVVYRNVFVLPKEISSSNEKQNVPVQDFASLDYTITESNINHSLDKPVIINPNLKPGFNDKMQMQNFEISPVSSINREENRFILEFKGSEYFFKDIPEIEPKKYARFNNNSISMFYRINPNWQAGIDIRQETFYLIYQGMEGERLYEYKMQPNFTTFSFAAGYNNKLIGPVNYNIRAFGGANYYGTVGRASLGFEYSFSPQISFILNGDYSYLLYNYQNRNYNSSKIGVNYGVSFKF